MSISLQIAYQFVTRLTTTLVSVILFSVIAPRCLLAQTTPAQEPKTKTTFAEIQVPSDDELLGAVARSIDVFKSQILPAQRKYNAEQAERWNEILDHRRMASLLEKANDQTLENIRVERAELIARIDFLSRLEATLTGKDPDAIENAITDEKSKIAELEKESLLAQRPYQDELSGIYKTYVVYNADFAKRFDPFLRKMGSGEFQTVKRTRASANYAYAEVSARYESDELALTVIIRLADVDQRKMGGASKQEMLESKYSITQSTNRGISILVGDIKVSIYSSKSDLEPGIFRKLLPSLIDLDLLNESLGRINH